MPIIVLAGPPTAEAHFRTGTVAVDYRARVATTPPGVSVRISTSDLAVGLTAGHGHTVTVPGYLGEPFLRLGPDGAAVNTASPTAAASGLLKKLGVPAGSGWRELSSAPAAVWHDARVRALPAGIDRRQWTLPVTVDGRPARLAGEVWREPRPAAWPWILLTLPFIGVAAAALRSRRPALIREAAMVLGAVAATAMVVSMAGFAADANAAPVTFVEGANEVVFAIVGFAFLVRGSPEARGLAGGALGLLSLGVGLTKVPALLHGVVLSVVPDVVARAGVVLMLASGAAAMVLGFVVLFQAIDWEERPSEVRANPSGSG